MARDFGATNEPLTCLWCGRKLRPWDSRRTLARRIQREKDRILQTANDYGADPVKVAIRATAREEEILRHHYEFRDRYGIAELFCTGTCGEMFAIAAANNGYRFKPKERIKIPRVIRFKQG